MGLRGSAMPANIHGKQIFSSWMRPWRGLSWTGSHVFLCGRLLSGSSSGIVASRLALIRDY
jgi:hypothetical protein